MDQKKKDLPPNTLPSEHKQWGAYVSAANQHAYPIAFSEDCYTIVTADTGDSAVGFGVKIVSKTEYYICGREGTNCHILMVGK